MRRWTSRLAMVAATAALTLGLPAMNAAYGAGWPHSPASHLDRLVDRLGRLGRLGLGGATVSGDAALRGVDLRARHDGWAVGGTCVSRTCSREHTLIERWNGRRWSRVPSPNPSASPTNGLNILASVTAVSGRDAWAAGATQGTTVLRSLFLRWNGTRWSAVPSPRRTGNSEILSISAASARDIWAIGTYGDVTSHALVEHWNGTNWRMVAAPARPRGQVQLTAVTAL